MPSCCSMSKTIRMYPLVCANKEKKDYRQSRAAEARKLNYAPDKKCQDAGGFSQEQRSISGNYLVRLGLLPPLPSRWNADGTWNW